MDEVAKQLNIDAPEGWYNITRKALVQQGGDGLIQKYPGAISTLLARVYPEYLAHYSTNFPSLKLQVGLIKI